MEKKNEGAVRNLIALLLVIFALVIGASVIGDLMHEKSSSTAVSFLVRIAMMKKIMIMTTMMITAHLAHHTVQVQAHLLQVLIVIVPQVRVSHVNIEML